jgi:hypothetical protein
MQEKRQQQPRASKHDAPGLDRTLGAGDALRVPRAVTRGLIKSPHLVARALAVEFADPLEKAKLPLTNRDRQRKHRTTNSERVFTLDVSNDGYADLVYLMKTWGFPSRRRTMIVALKYLANATRNGLERIDLTTD